MLIWLFRHQALTKLWTKFWFKLWFVVMSWQKLIKWKHMFNLILLICFIIFLLKIMLTNQVLNMSKKKSENVFQKVIFRSFLLFFVTDQIQCQIHTANHMTNTERNESENVISEIFVNDIFRFSFRLSFIQFFTELNFTDFNQNWYLVKDFESKIKVLQ